MATLEVCFWFSAVNVITTGFGAIVSPMPPCRYVFSLSLLHPGRCTVRSVMFAVRPVPLHLDVRPDEMLSCLVYVSQNGLSTGTTQPRCLSPVLPGAFCGAAHELAAAGHHRLQRYV